MFYNSLQLVIYTWHYHVFIFGIILGIYGSFHILIVTKIFCFTKYSLSWNCKLQFTGQQISKLTVYAKWSHVIKNVTISISQQIKPMSLWKNVYQKRSFQKEAEVSKLCALHANPKALSVTRGSKCLLHLYKDDGFMRQW